MSLSVRNNIAALVSHHNTKKSDSRLSTSLERLASGSNLTHLSHNPAASALSDRLRADLVSRNQAMKNNEVALSMVQMAESSLAELNAMLNRLRMLGVQASNEAVLSPEMLAATQEEVENLLQSIDSLGERLTHATQPLLDGSQESKGFVEGQGLEFISATASTKQSPAGGYAVDIFREATRSRLESIRPITKEIFAANEVSITLQEGGKSMEISALPEETLDAFIQRVNHQAEKQNIPVRTDIQGTEERWIGFEHQEYGSEHSFKVAISAPGILAPEDFNYPLKVDNGLDVVGTIGGNEAIGKGQYLSGAPGTEVEDLTLRFTGFADYTENSDDQYNINYKEVYEDELDKSFDPRYPNKGKTEGVVHIANDALLFQTGADGKQYDRLSLPDVRTNNLARNVQNDSGFTSLADVSVLDFTQAQDTIRMAKEAGDAITDMRARIGAFQEHVLVNGERHLRQTMAELEESRSRIADTDTALEAAAMTRHQLAAETAAKMTQRASETHKSLFSLVG